MFLTMTFTPLAKTSGVKSEKGIWSTFNINIYFKTYQYGWRNHSHPEENNAHPLSPNLQSMAGIHCPRPERIKIWPVQSTFRSIYLTIKRRPLRLTVHRNKWMVILNLLNKNLHSWLLANSAVLTGLKLGKEWSLYLRFNPMKKGSIEIYWDKLLT